VFANIYEPWTDMVLWIGVRFVSCTHAAHCHFLIGDENGSKNSERFISKEAAYTEWMRSALIKAQTKLGEMGLVEAVGNLAHELSPHSYKKECEEKLTTESGGPPATSAFLRVGQNLNAVVQRYVRDDRYSDELCGRILAGYRTHDPQFGTLPPRFNPEKFPEGIPYDEIIRGWTHIERHYPRFVPVLKYALASVVHHTDWLLKNLPKDHAFHTSLYITRGWHSVENLRRPGGVLVGEIFCPTTKIRATGVPLYIMNSIQITELTNRVAAMEDKLDRLCQSVADLVVKCEALGENSNNLK
jgi:hypothetical protein